MGLFHEEVKRQIVDKLIRNEYIVKTEAWLSTSNTSAKWIKPYVHMNFFKTSPYRYLHNPRFQTRIDILAVFIEDIWLIGRLPCEDIAKRTILIEVEDKHSIEKAIKRIKPYEVGAKAIVKIGISRRGELDGIPILKAERDIFGEWYIDGLHELILNHKEEIIKN